LSAFCIAADTTSTPEGGSNPSPIIGTLLARWGYRCLAFFGTGVYTWNQKRTFVLIGAGQVHRRQRINGFNHLNGMVFERPEACFHSHFDKERMARLMTLYELGEEYTQQSTQIRAQILKLRPQLKTLQGDAYLQLKNRILKLYAIAGECRETGEYLKNYYKQS